jgi:hypothetical protein
VQEYYDRLCELRGKVAVQENHITSIIQCESRRRVVMQELKGWTPIYRVIIKVPRPAVMTWSAIPIVHKAILSWIGAAKTNIGHDNSRLAGLVRYVDCMALALFPFVDNPHTTLHACRRPSSRVTFIVFSPFHSSHSFLFPRSSRLSRRPKQSPTPRRCMRSPTSACTTTSSALIPTGA